MNGPAAGMLDLRGLHLPEAAGLWPPAPGWWILGAVVLVLLAWALLMLLRQLRRWRLRRSVLTELERLAADSMSGATGGQRLATRVSNLLKRAALLGHPRREVAALSGEPWLRFLDRTGGNGNFSSGAGRVLATAPYAPARTMGELQPIDARALIDISKSWVRRNL